MVNCRSLLLLSTIAFLITGTAHSQSVTALQRARIIDSASALARARYVFPKLGDSIAGRLRANAAANVYEGDTTPQAFAGALMRDLRVISNDKHFGILTPEMAAQRGLRDLPRGAVAPPAGEFRAANAARTERERRLNFYFRAYERLPGNVAYLAFDQFPEPTGARETATAMMQLLGNAAAIILDLRANPGGVEGLNQFLSSFFMNTPGEVLYQRYYREGDSTLSVRVLKDLPAPRIPATPLYILTSKRTGSAAENLTYTLQSHQRATVVGDTTTGAANSSTVFPLPEGYFMQVPIARVIQPRTGTNWEGVGVIPNVLVPAAHARDTAYAMALRGLRNTTTDVTMQQEIVQALRSFEGATTASDGAGSDGSAQASITALPLSPTELQKFVGQYGDRTITCEGNSLYIQRPGGQVLKLIQKGVDTFTLEIVPDATLVFIRDSAGIPQEIRVRQGTEPWQTSKRNPGT